MVSLGTWKDYSVSLSLKLNCVTISLTKTGDVRVYSFDLYGRWWTGVINGISYRRGLNGRVVAKWMPAIDQHERRWLEQTEASDLEEFIRKDFEAFSQDLAQGSLTLSPEISPSDQLLLDKIARYSPADSADDVASYHQIYKPVGILPPDQYMALVLQASEGCSFNSCTFCNFYHDRPFRVKSLPEFEDHIIKIKDYLAEGLSLRRTIFLGDANALVIPTPRLITMLETVHRNFDVEQMGGIYAFLDGFSGERKTRKEYEQLASLGVKRIYIGMESGNPTLLNFMNKPGSPVDVLNAVKAMKSGGLSVGIIILLGAGGKQFSQDHVKDTIHLMNQMDLGMDDLIYFSELIESEGMEYTQKAFEARLQPMIGGERLRQAEEIESKLRFSIQKGTPHMSRYDIREFVY